ncbi:uncharacterized protein TRIADDRAFT_27299 [Trichoplax adhaerens]|uniref:C2 Aida-type domain-containing protein n=1 Tax=Trichoplax adhaerens TaxID=10228 RepID=B3S0C8_TRIAD|nr:hypothetical protein TRIADDRAFT_27299 [Trichoplax adhaerens]EDV24357.1 hypothetical protein TRIADDRAFT_27299 [Trichoplax adhaerens]|eukprot:XP_002113883.1 hypothetical protein TRIADDRAFT_27299 [Trichoplax adhaerens]
MDNGTKLHLSSSSGHHLYVCILKIQVKNATQIVDPYITVSLKDRQGMDLCDIQNTPIATIKEGNEIYFNNNIAIPIPLTKVPKDAAIFFELKHFKVKKKSTSIKCFAFLEENQMKEGHVCTELYKKPVDYKRRKLSLLTSQPVFLHLDLAIV